MKQASFLGFVNKAVVSVFFIGYLPLIPGTFGSLAGVGLFYLVGQLNSFVYFLSLVVVILLGLSLSGGAEKLFNKKDPSRVVIDEVAGMLIALAFMPLDLRIIVLGFILFRIFDTIKPYPADKIQNLHGAVGIMADDIIAGIYTNIVLQVVLNLARARGM
jgi:phosphatidylglycerophosphatase A